MLPYCLKFKKNTESINSKISATINGKTMILKCALTKCALSGSKNQNLLKNKQEKNY